MIELTNLSLTIRDHDTLEQKPVLNGISLHMEKGEAVGLVGESGSGKSMTLRCILGIEPTNSTVTGEIALAGQNLRGLPPQRMRQVRSSRISLISQNPHAALNPVLPIETYLLEGMQEAGRRTNKIAARRRAGELLEQVGIRSVDRVLKAYPHQLSGGMLQRVVIAGAIAGKPELLLADEPTTALDVTTQAEVVAILDEKRRDFGMAMIFVTHDLDLAAAVCDRLAVMRYGEIVEIGTPAQIRDHPQHPYTQLLMSVRPRLDAEPPHVFLGSRQVDAPPTAMGDGHSAVEPGTDIQIGRSL